MAHVIRTEKRKRGAFGMLLWLIFIAFNILMAVWLFAGLASVGDVYGGASSSAEQAGAAIGGVLATGVMLWTWLFGSAILGIFVLLSRGKKVTIEKIVE